MEPSPEISRAEMGERQQRSSRALLILISIVMVLTLTLPFVIGIASYWLLGHYDVASGMLRLWVSVGTGLVGVFLLNLLIMIPLTAVAATQSMRFDAAFQGQGPDDAHARKLIHTLASQDDKRADVPATSDQSPTSPSPDASTSDEDGTNSPTFASKEPLPPND